MPAHDKKHSRTIATALLENAGIRPAERIVEAVASIPSVQGKIQVVRQLRETRAPVSTAPGFDDLLSVSLN